MNEMTRRQFLRGAGATVVTATAASPALLWLEEQMRRLDRRRRYFFFFPPKREMVVVAGIESVVFSVTDPTTGQVVAQWDGMPPQGLSAVEATIEEFASRMRQDTWKRYYEMEAGVVADIRVGNRRIPVRHTDRFEVSVCGKALPTTGAET